jgi:ATP-binding protein involved in chromosome partitioning
LGIPFLGRLQLSSGLRESSDAGEPPAAADGPEAKVFAQIAKKLLAQLETVGG